MKQQPFGGTAEQEAKEIELFLRQYDLIEPGGPWVALIHQDRPDFKIFSEARVEERLVELTSIYLDDESVVRDHVRREKGPIAIPYDAGQVETYKSRIVRTVEKKCRSFKNEFGSRVAVLSLYLNEYIAIYLTKEDVLELLLVDLPRVAADGPFDQIVLWGGFPHTPVMYRRDEITGKTETPAET